MHNNENEEQEDREYAEIASALAPVLTAAVKGSDLTEEDIDDNVNDHVEALGKSLDPEYLMDETGAIPALEKSSKAHARRIAFNGLFRYADREDDGGGGISFDHVVVQTVPFASNARMSLVTGDVKLYDSNGSYLCLLNIFKPEGWKK